MVCVECACTVLACSWKLDHIVFYLFIKEIITLCFQHRNHIRFQLVMSVLNTHEALKLFYFCYFFLKDHVVKGGLA